GPDRMLEALKQGAEAIPSIWGVPLPPVVRERLVKNDVEAMVACRTQGLQSPGFAETLPKITTPCLLFAGAADPTYPHNKECVRSMPTVPLFSLPDLGHADAFLRSDLVLPHVKQFLASISR